MKKRYLLSISIVLNILLTLSLLAIFVHLGGVSKIRGMLGGSSEPVNTYYLERTSLFNEFDMPEDAVVFLGDSITFRSEWAEFFPDRPVFNRGIGSDTTTGILDRLDTIAAAQPSKVFILAGVNDLLNDDVSTISANYEEIVDRILDSSENTEVYIQSVLPVNNEIYGNAINNDKVKLLNQELVYLSEKEHVTYIDLYSALSGNDQLLIDYTVDGIHLNGDGYRVWADIIYDQVMY